MAEARDETFFERTLANLKGPWREVASSAARSIGLNEAEAASPRDAKALRALMAACLEARGGEGSARLRAAELGKAYLERDVAGRRLFLEILAHEFAVDRTAVEDQILAYRSADTPEAGLAAEAALWATLLPPRLKLLTQFNVLPEGVKFLVDLRADLLRLASDEIETPGWYPLSILYFEKRNTSTLQLYWTRPGDQGGLKFVPPDAFAHLSK